MQWQPQILWKPIPFKDKEKRGIRGGEEQRESEEVKRR